MLNKLPGQKPVSDAPGDMRHAFRRIVEGNLGRVQLPILEALADHVSRNLALLAGAVSSAALVVGGSLLSLTRLGGQHHALGETMIISGIFSMLISVGVWLRGRGRR